MRRIALLACLALAPGLDAEGQDGSKPTRYRVYVGTYTGPQSRGIYQFTLNLGDGSVEPPKVAAETPSPSFLAFHPSRKFLFAVNEVGDFRGKHSGSVSAFAIDRDSGRLDYVNTQGSGGADPCYLAIDATGRHALVANYSGGSVATLPIGPDGKLGEASTVIKHLGSGPNKARQAGPHAHSINLDAANRFAVAADLGLDRLLVYRFEPASGQLRANEPPSLALPPGSGPRHFAFHPDGRHAYVINELASTVALLDYDPEGGVLAEVQSLSTRPEGATRPGNSTAEVVVHPSGRFLYGSNRGDDALAIYRIDPASGRLTGVGFQATGGKIPRNFAIEPTGKYLLAANQDSGTVVVFEVDPATGLLRQVGKPVAVPSPVCIRFLGID